jgi:hypothetical protein
MDDEQRRVIRPYLAAAVKRVRGIADEHTWRPRIQHLWKNALFALIQHEGGTRLCNEIRASSEAEIEKVAKEYELTYEHFQSEVFLTQRRPSRMPVARPSKPDLEFLPKPRRARGKPS